VRIDQIVFGYRDGHRRLAGSVELDRDAGSLLLGATDARVSAEVGRLVTALALPSADRYALSATWPAPEAERPGAVWAHTLLLTPEQLAGIDQGWSLVRAFRRPTRDTLDSYGSQLAFDPGAAGSAGPTVESSLMIDVISAALNPDGIAVVRHSDLGAGEAALVALWTAAWPALRVRLAFRTRDRFKATRNAGYICVARRVTGMLSPPPSSQLPSEDSAWGRRIAAWDPQVRRFLREFGPAEKPHIDRLTSLASLFELVASALVRPAVDHLAREYPKPQAGRMLKVALLGSAPSWWKVTEIEVLTALLAARTPAFDPEALNLAERLRQAISASGLAALLDAGADAPPKMRALLVEAIGATAHPAVVLTTLRNDRDFGEEVLRSAPSLLEDPELWRAANEAEVRAFARRSNLPNQALDAALEGGRLREIADALSVATLLRRAVVGGFIRRLLTALNHDGDVAAAAFTGDGGDELRLELAAAGGDAGPRTDVLAALEHTRSRPDETWLRVAADLLAASDRRSRRDVLEVVFGPLHHAMTDDRLPRELWRSLDRVLPDAHDPALRLRRLLVELAREEQWPRATLERALRDGGPHVAEIRHDVEKDDPLSKLLKDAVKAIRDLTR
jgi:hypothetical protein